ncbi:ribonuclease J [Chloropicon primus]|nr:ribonuclease J [Chloropicon primus]
MRASGTGAATVAPKATRSSATTSSSSCSSRDVAVKAGQRRGRGGGGGGQKSPFLKKRLRLRKSSDGVSHLGSSLKSRGNRPFPGPPKGQGPPLRILPIGGLGEIGMNCMLVGHKDRYIMLDAGLMFPDFAEIGMQKVLPDTSFLHQWKDLIECVIITHGHEDHIGALAWVLPGLDPSTPVYATKFVMNLIERRMKEYNLWNTSRFKTFEVGQRFQTGPFEFESFRVTHSIPDCIGCIFRSESGNIVHTGDWRIEEKPEDLDGDAFDRTTLERIGQEGATLLMSDSTNVLAPGRTTSESDVGLALANRMAGHHGKGRIIATQFASNINRLGLLKKAADACGRKLAFAGPSLAQYLDAAHRAGRAPFDPAELLDIEEAIDGYDANKLVIVTTGSQAEPRAALNLAAFGASPFLKIQPDDLILYSAKVIPGNESRVMKMMNSLAGYGCEIAMGRDENLHTSGHAYQEEQKEVLKMVNPDNFLPVHGEYAFLQAHAAMAEQHCGIKNTNVIRNGQMIGFGAKRSASQVGELSSLAKVVGNVKLFSFYNDGGKGTGTSDQMQLYERMKIAQEGIVFTNVEVMNRLASKTKAKAREKVPTGIQVNLRITARAMWIDEGRLISEMNRFVKTRLKDLPLNSSLNEIEKVVSEELRRCCKSHNNKRPEVIVMAHDSGAGGMSSGGGAYRGRRPAGRSGAAQAVKGQQPSSAQGAGAKVPRAVYKPRGVGSSGKNPRESPKENPTAEDLDKIEWP